jgi:hypothetical protein
LTAVKHVVKAAKTKLWEEFGEFMEEYSKDNQTLFYKILKNMWRGKDCPLKYIKDKEGKLLIGEKEIMNRWRKYFQELLECKEKEQAETEVHQNTEETRLVISLEELKTAIRKMKLGKAAGHNQITPEMVKYMGLEGEKLLLRVIQLAWRYKKIPSDWERSVIIPIFKKGDNRKCSNHRGSSLLSVPGKVYSWILETRLKEQVEHHLEEAQCGFQQG